MAISKVFLVALLPLLLIPAYAQEAQPENQIPSWVKGVFNFWVDGGINDSELIAAIQFLIEEGIIELHENQTEDTTEKDQEIQELTDDLEELETEFQQYKKDNRLNDDPVDGDSVSEDTVKNLQNQLEDKEIEEDEREEEEHEEREEDEEREEEEERDEAKDEEHDDDDDEDDEDDEDDK